MSISSVSSFISSSSASSAILKEGSSSILSICSLITDKQKLSIVLILALSISVSCLFNLLYFSLPCFCNKSFSSRLLAILSFISKAAALVKVITKSSSISVGLFSSVIWLMILSTNMAVFPLPAAAETKICLFLVSMAACCSLVHFLVI